MNVIKDVFFDFGIIYLEQSLKLQVLDRASLCVRHYKFDSFTREIVLYEFKHLRTFGPGSDIQDGVGILVTMSVQLMTSFNVSQ